MAYSTKTAQKLVLETGLKMQQDGLIARTWGNISARVSEQEMVITPSGRAYSSLTPEDIVPVNIADGSWENTAVKPSSEKLVHMILYQEHPEVNFIIHTHQAYASALSILGKDIGEPVIPCAGYGRNATVLLQSNVAAAVRRNPGTHRALMKNHGAVVFDVSREAAEKDARELEWQAESVYESLVTDAPQMSFGLTAKDPEGIHSYERRVSAPGDRGVLLELASPVVQRASVLAAERIQREGSGMPAYLDDLAQICGVSVPCADPGERKRAETQLLTPGGAAACFVRGEGAVCAGPDENEAKAVAMVLEKNSLAFLLAEAERAAGEEIPPLGREDAEEDRSSYLAYYSKLMNP